MLCFQTYCTAIHCVWTQGLGEGGIGVGERETSKTHTHLKAYTSVIFVSRATHMLTMCPLSSGVRVQYRVQCRK